MNETLAIGGARSAEPRTDEFSTLLRMLGRRRRVMAITFGSFVILVLLFTLLTPKRYTTEVQLIAGSSGQGLPATNNDTSLPVLNALLQAGNAQSSETYAALLHETPVAQATIDQLNLKMSVAALQSHIAIKPVTNTSLLGVAVTWPTAVGSAQVANTYVAAFVDRERELVGRQADTAMQSLDAQLPAAKHRAEAAQAALIAYQRTSKIIDPVAQTSARLNQSALLQNTIDQGELTVRESDAQIAALRSQLASTPQTIVGSQTSAQNPVVAQLDTQIAQTSQQLDVARQTYTEKHPVVQGLENSLAKLQRRRSAAQPMIDAQTAQIANPIAEQLITAIGTASAARSSAEAQIAGARRQLAVNAPMIDALPGGTQKINGLQRDLEIATNVYDAIRKKYDDALISKATALSDVSVSQPADPAAASVSPNLFFNLGAGVLVGAVLALAVGFGLGFLDDRLVTDADVEERLALPVLARVPHVPEVILPQSEWIREFSVESYLQFVTSLRYAGSIMPRSITVTSAQQGDGKSTVALRTAEAFASLGIRVLLIDADMRRPSLHTKIQIPNTLGLSDILVGVVSMQPTLRSVAPDISVITAGRRPPNPMVLLESDAFDGLLVEAREQFDLVILDGTALAPVSDAVIVAAKSDATVLVVSAEKTPSGMAYDAVKRLKAIPAIKLLGVVLNSTRPKRSSYSSYYGLPAAPTTASLPG